MRSHGKITPQWKSTLNHLVLWWDEKLTVPHFCGNNSANTLDLWKCSVKSPFYLSVVALEKSWLLRHHLWFPFLETTSEGWAQNAILMMTCYNPVLQAHVKSTCVNKIEALYERPRGNIKGDRGSTFMSTREHPCIVSISFTRVKCLRRLKVVVPGNRHLSVPFLSPHLASPPSFLLVIPPFSFALLFTSKIWSNGANQCVSLGHLTRAYLLPVNSI